ncbi:MAG: hypothetical protein ACRD2N_06180 [Vicinamibacterales bacterium]
MEAVLACLLHTKTLLAPETRAMANKSNQIFSFRDKNVRTPAVREWPALVVHNVPPMLIESIGAWARRRHLSTDDAAIELLRMAVDATLPEYDRVSEKN